MLEVSLRCFGNGKELSDLCKVCAGCFGTRAQDNSRSRIFGKVLQNRIHATLYFFGIHVT